MSNQGIRKALKPKRVRESMVKSLLDIGQSLPSIIQSILITWKPQVYQTEGVQSRYESRVWRWGTINRTTPFLMRMKNSIEIPN